jgi:hypothetical protein
VTNQLNQAVENEWVSLPGGELEGRRPKTLCGPCRLRRAAGAPQKAICFECYRADRERERALKAAGEFESSAATIVERFQHGLPFESVNIARLEQLKIDRASARRQAGAGVGQYVDKRRQAQIAARHALQRLGTGLRGHDMHAAELQLPPSWLPFVASSR